MRKEGSEGGRERKRGLAVQPSQNQQLLQESSHICNSGWPRTNLRWTGTIALPGPTHLPHPPTAEQPTRSYYVWMGIVLLSANI